MHPWKTHRENKRPPVVPDVSPQIFHFFHDFQVCFITNFLFQLGLACIKTMICFSHTHTHIIRIYFLKQKETTMFVHLFFSSLPVRSFPNLPSFCFFCGVSSAIIIKSTDPQEVQIFGNALPTSWGSGARLVGGPVPWPSGLDGGWGWRSGFQMLAGWFQIFFIFTPIWGRFPFWLIFFKGVETTN